MNNKKGLEYFPFDIDFFQDEKIQFVSARFGMKGEAITIRLLCKIYRNGYYIDWNEDTELLFAKSVGDGCQHSCVRDVVHELLKRGFFDKSIFERFAVLTSRGIQRRFLEASERRKRVEINKDFLLINIADYPNVCVKNQNVNITDENVYILGQNADILKQSKGKESKVNKDSSDEESMSEQSKIAPTRQSAAPESERAGKERTDSDRVPYKQIMELYNSVCTKLPKITGIEGGKRQKAVKARYAHYGGLETFRTLFEKANNSLFMTGNNKRNWTADFDFLMTADGMAKTLEGKYDNTERLFGGSEQANETPEKTNGKVDYQKWQN